MKSLMILAFAVCFICIVVAEVGRVCEGPDDCDAGECCVHIHSFTSHKCKKLRQQDDFCFPNVDLNEVKKGVYRYMCPCDEGLYCKANKVTEEDGFTRYDDVKCVKKE